MCINSACKNIRKPRIRRSHGRCPAGDGPAGFGATAPSPSPASLSVSPSDLRPHKVPVLSPSLGSSAGDGGPRPRVLVRPGVLAKPLSPVQPLTSLQLLLGSLVPQPTLDTHGLQGLPWVTNPPGQCRPPAWCWVAVRLRCAPDSRGPREGTTKSPPLEVRGRVRAHLGGRSPPSPPQRRDAKPPRAGAKLGRPRALPRCSTPRLFGPGVPGRPPRPHPR
jgi:hypothetical protein